MWNDKSSKISLCLLGVKGQNPGNFVNILTVDFKEVARRENLEQFLENFLVITVCDLIEKFECAGKITVCGQQGYQKILVNGG